MKNKKILFGICGSFCNHKSILNYLKILCDENDVQVIVSENVYNLDTRFFKADDFINILETYTNKKVWHTLIEAERVGPFYEFDLMVIAPMSATVLSKLKNGCYDHPITLAAKAHLRNNGILVLSVASNDLLSISGVNLFTLLNYKNIYFVPFYQDNPSLKPNSIVSDFSLLIKTMDLALLNKQIQPILIERKDNG